MIVFPIIAGYDLVNIDPVRHISWRGRLIGEGGTPPVPFPGGVGHGLAA